MRTNLILSLLMALSALTMPTNAFADELVTTPMVNCAKKNDPCYSNPTPVHMPEVRGKIVYPKAIRVYTTAEVEELIKGLGERSEKRTAELEQNIVARLAAAKGDALSEAKDDLVYALGELDAAKRRIAALEARVAAVEQILAERP